MGIHFSRDKEAGESGKRKVVITASPGACAGLGVVMLLCFVWVFVFGLIVGRGYQPEEVVPELKQFMPSAQKNAAAPEPTRTTDATTDKNSAEPSVIKPEDLNFYEQLKKEPAAPITAARATDKGRSTTAPAASAAKPAASSTDETQQRFDYLYQVAASKDKTAAESLAARIESNGLRTRVESVLSGGQTWYRILVLFRGTPEDTRGMKDILKRLGIDKPLLKEKNAV